MTVATNHTDSFRNLTSRLAVFAHPLLTLQLGACQPEELDGCAPSSEPGLELGAGTRAFVEAPTEMTLLQGPQGGYHLEISLRAKNIAIDTPVAIDIEGVVNGETLAWTELWVEFKCNVETNSAEALGVHLMYDGTADELHEQTTEIYATLVHDPVVDAQQAVLIDASAMY